MESNAPLETKQRGAETLSAHTAQCVLSAKKLAQVEKGKTEPRQRSSRLDYLTCLFSASFFDIGERKDDTS